jgi:hypothetical protein
MISFKSTDPYKPPFQLKVWHIAVLLLAGLVVSGGILYGAVKIVRAAWGH